MVKKKVLFIMPTLECGGAEKSLVTLLNSIEYDKYEVDLLLFEKRGIFVNSIPSHVNILNEINVIKYFNLPLKKSIKQLIPLKKEIAFNRVIAPIKYKVSKNKIRQLQKNWKFVSKGIEKVNKEYDAVIGYLEMWPIYFAVEKVKAKIKIGYIHTDYKNYGMDPKFDKEYFEKLDYIFTVSNECKNTLDLLFPEIEKKILVMENIISKNSLNKMAINGKGFDNDFYGIRILTIGRLDYNKGYDLAIKACAKLIKDGYNIRWYAIGDGTQKVQFMNLVSDYNMTNNFIFLGTIENPYPFLKQADIYVHPSRLEGKSIAIEEAKVLCKPIVVTRYATVTDQIQDKEDGIIVNIDEESLYMGIKSLLDNNNLKEGLSFKLFKKDFSNESAVVEKFNQLIKKKNVVFPSLQDFY